MMTVARLRPTRALLSVVLVWLGVNALALIDLESAHRIVLNPLTENGPALDWELYREAGTLIASGSSPYGAAVGACGDVCAFRHSPAVAWFFSIPFPIELFRIGQLLSLLLLPPAVAVLAITTWAFWADVAMGQPITFAFVLGVLAVRGNRWAGIAFLVMATLMPRPLMVPVALWILLYQPGTRLPFAIVTLFHMAWVIASGWAGPWAGSLLSATDDAALLVNYAPSRWIGLWWLALSLPAAVVLFRRGQLGLASLAASPYLFPYYLLLGLIPPVARDASPEEPRSN